MKPTLGSLFAGIGGIDLGFERAGFETVWQVEINPYCRKVLARHFPNAERFEDVRTVGKHNLRPVDVIAGGFPCQDISNAGKRAGIEGELSGLWREIPRILSALRPKFALVENVAALLARGIERVLGDLAEIGYDAEWEVISAADIGADHERERLWLLAYPAQEQGFYKSLGILRQARLSANRRQWRGSGAWDEATPKLCRMDDGVPDRVVQTELLGNAVVPQIPELIANRIRECLEAA